MTNLQVKYHLLKTIVNLLGLFEWLAGGYGLISFSTKTVPGWQLAIGVLMVSYFTSCELGYYVSRLQIRLELERNKEQFNKER